MNQALADALEIRGYTTLTPVQEAVTKPELGEADLLVSAQTGSGKTVGFGLAIASTLLGEATSFEQAGKPLALIIAPTRELAMQVKRELAWLYGQTGAVVASCVGGMDMRDERRALDRGAHIVVATPGRLRDHIMRGSLDMSDLRAVVLDEADEMLDLGFREDLEFILGEAPETRRTLLFSATVPRAIVALAKGYQRDAIRIVTTSDTDQHADIEYRALHVSARDAENAIINVLRFYEAPNALVFCNTRAMVNRLTTRFSNRGFSVVALSGELTQNERTHALQAMRDGRARVCIATDVAARGIDLPNLELVIHADLPSNAETMLHRSGRTGRAGRKGVSALIVPPKSRRKAESLLRAGKVSAEWSEAPSAEAVIARDEERLLADPTWQTEITEQEAASAKKLTDLYSAEVLAAAYLRLFNARQSAPEDLAPSDSFAPAKPHAEFGPSIWFSVEGGRDAGAEPRRLLPMLCKVGDLTKEDIGAIRIQQDASFVEISAASVPRFLAAIGADMKVEAGAKLTQLDKPPAVAGTPRPSFSPKGDARGAPRKPYQGKSEGGYQGKSEGGYKGKSEGGYKGKSEGGYKGKSEGGYKGKSEGDYKGKSEGGYKGKAKYDAKPAHSSDAPARAARPAPSSAPIDWNDDPAPRAKKPRHGKPGAPAKRPREGAKPLPEGVLSEYKPRAKSGGDGKARHKASTPVGKPSSKKNKARRANASDTSKSLRGGNVPPKRGKKAPPKK